MSADKPINTSSHCLGWCLEVGMYMWENVAILRRTRAKSNLPRADLVSAPGKINVTVKMIAVAL